MENIYTDPSLVSGGLLSATAAPAAAPISITDAQRWLYPRYGEQVGVRDKLLEAMAGLGFNGQNISGTQDLRQLEALSGMSPAELSDLYAQLERDNGKQFMNDGADWIKAQALQGRATTKQAQDWLTQNGYRVDTQDNGSVQTQRLLDSQGRSVAEDVFDYQSYLSSENKAVDTTAAITAAILGGMYMLPEATAAAGGTGAGSAGTSTLSASMAGSAPTVTTAALPTGMTAGMTGGSALGYVPTSAQLFGAGGAAASAGLSGAGGGGTSTLSSSLAGTAPSVTTQGISSGMTAGMTGGSSLGYVPTAAEAFAGAGAAGAGGHAFGSQIGGEALASNIPGGGSGLLGSLGSALTESGLGKAVGSVADMVGGGKNLAGIVGGIAGATQGGKDQTATTTQQIDPRMAQYLYGTGYGDKQSLLGAAQDWWKNNQSGMNANMVQGLDTLKSLYTSPGYTQGYTQMRDVGQGLLGRQIAGNPFTQGGLLGAPQQMPAQGQPAIQPPQPDIGVPPQMMQRPPMGLLQGAPQQMPGPDVGLQKFNRPAWSI